MKITVYTITNCQFSKAEKEYLTAHNLPFEEKNLETNKEYLTEMLAVSNNFAGTPVTKIEKDDGQIVVLKGFTKEEFDKVLNLAPELSVTQPSASSTPSQPTPPPQTTPTSPPPAPTNNPTPPTSPSPTPPPPPSTNQPTNPSPTQADDPLNSILNDLQAKSTQPASNQPADQSGPTSPDLTPPPPTIPDFPAKM